MEKTAVVDINNNQTVIKHFVMENRNEAENNHGRIYHVIHNCTFDMNKVKESKQ